MISMKREEILGRKNLR